MNNGKKHICPLDQRKFATKAALRQHRNAAHASVQGKAPQRAKTQRQRGLNRAKTVCRGDSNARVVSGSDVIGISSNITTSTAVGTVVGSFIMTPEYFPNTRMASEAALWARWKPVSLRLLIQPSAGAMVTGTYAVGFTYDVNAQLATGTAAVMQINACNPSATATVYNPTILNIPCDTAQKWYHVDSREQEDSAHGKFFIVLTSMLGNVTSDSNISFMFKLNWTLQFEGAVLPSSSKGTAYTVYADEGYEGYFTSSDGSYDSTKLTVKARHGGSMVQFSLASTDTIYKLDTQAKLQYYYSSSNNGKNLTLRSIGYAVVIKDYQGKGFAVFESLAQASQYQRSGSRADMLPYWQGGDPIVPINPAWTSQDASELNLSTRLSELELKIEQLTLQLAQGLPSTSSSVVDFQLLDQ